MSKGMYCPIETAKRLKEELERNLRLKEELERNLRPQANFIESLNRLIQVAEMAKGYTEDPIAKLIQPFPCQYRKETVDA